jgi:hypothetical protein
MSFSGRMLNGVAVLDTPVDLPDGTRVRIDVERGGSDFWQDKTIDDFAREQRVQPIRDLDELAGDWPDEDSVDELLALLRKVRS